MSLLNFLGNMLGGIAQPDPSMSGDSSSGYDMSDASSRIAAWNPSEQNSSQQVQMPHHSKLANFLGMIGDALLAGSGGQPIYRPRIEQEKLGATLASSLGNSDPNMMALAQQDPETFLKVWQAKNAKPDLPAVMQEYQAYQELPDEKKPSFEKFMTLVHPGMQVPIVMQPGDTILGGGASSGPPAAAVAHLQAHPELSGAFDQKYGSGAAARVLGGATASPSGNFPR